VLYVLGVNEGGQVVLSYTHSIYRIAVREEFVVRNSSLILTQVVMGEGTALEPSDQEAAFMMGGSVTLSGPIRELKAFRIRIGEVGRPVLIVGDRQLDLAQLAGLGNSVEVRLKP